MANDHPDAPKPWSYRLSEETIEENKKLLAKIDSKSILLAPAVMGSLYFYIDSQDAGKPSKEELIDDPFALDLASTNLGIEIRNEDMHHRWVAQASQALKILEFATIHLNQKNHDSSIIFGVNVELKWQDGQGQETIVHLWQSKNNSNKDTSDKDNSDKNSAEWQVRRYI